MTVRELDDLILLTLQEGPRSAEQIHERSQGRCTLYDVQAALNILTRNGNVKELRIPETDRTGTYELVVSDDDYSIGETFRAMREESQERRAHHREASPRLLREAGIPFTEHNGGAHLIVDNPPTVDFWPGTGKWIVRGTNKKMRGVLHLIRYLRPPGHKWSLRSVIGRGRHQISNDIMTGRVPHTVASFAELHDYVDANGYGGAFEDGAPEPNNVDFWNAVHNALDAWIKGWPR